MQVIDFLKKDQAVTAFIAKTSRIKNSLLTGVERGAFAVLIQAYLAQVGQPLLLIEENEYKAQERYNDLSRLLADDDLGLLPWTVTWPRKRRSVHRTNSAAGFSA